MECWSGGVGNALVIATASEGYQGLSIAEDHLWKEEVRKLGGGQNTTEEEDIPGYWNNPESCFKSSIQENNSK